MVGSSHIQYIPTGGLCVLDLARLLSNSPKPDISCMLAAVEATVQGFATQEVPITLKGPQGSIANFSFQ